MAEFSLIDWIKQHADVTKADHVLLGIGDDGCCLRESENSVWSMDTMVSGVHFDETASPESLGHKSLAVSASDCVAMGSQPMSVLLSLSYPTFDEPWLHAFFAGFFSYARKHNIALVGGDLTKGPCSITTSVQGRLLTHRPWRRSCAKVGDEIWVTGYLGLAASAVSGIRTDEALQALHYPEPPIALVQPLASLVNAAIDVSDGFAQDLGHVLKASNLGARVGLHQLPGIENPLQTPEDKLHWQLYGGDDYQLCFTAAIENRDAIVAAAQASSIPIHRVGVCHQGNELTFYNEKGELVELKGHAWEHFS